MPSVEQDGAVATAFISCADKYMGFAEMAKDYLGICGIDAFIAKDDIRTGNDWRKNIIDEIKKREYFVLLLSSIYHEEEFTDQEFGMAVAHDKKIFIVMMDSTEPYGFMRHYRHINMNRWYDQVHMVCAALSKAAGEISGMTDGVGVDFNIQALGKSRFYSEANYNARIIQESPEFRNEGFTGSQINLIARHYVENIQINRADSKVTNRLLEFLLERSSHIERDIYERLTRFDRS